MRPDTTIFDQHVLDPEFQAGVDRGDWGLHGTDSDYPTWPVVIFWVKAAAKPGKPDRYYFRFDLQGYPATAPTACPWDITKNGRLDNPNWPRGNSLVSRVFNFGWRPDALYAPCDRMAMIGHDPWRQQYPELWWQPTFKITVYLHFLFQLLNSADYEKS